MRPRRPTQRTSCAASVMNGTGGVWTVRTTDGAQHQATMRGRLKQEGADKIAVGDDVRLEEEDRGGSWVIAEIYPAPLAARAPRAGRRARRARRRREHRSGHRRVRAREAGAASAHARPLPRDRRGKRHPGAHRSQQARARERACRAWLEEYRLAGYPIHFTSVKAQHRSRRARRTRCTGAPPR